MLHSSLHPVPLYPMNSVVKRGIHSELLIDVLWTNSQCSKISGLLVLDIWSLQCIQWGWGWKHLWYTTRQECESYEHHAGSLFLCWMWSTVWCSLDSGRGCGMDVQGMGYLHWVLHSIQFGWHNPTSGVWPGKLLLAQLSLLRSYACGNMSANIASVCKQQDKHVEIHILFHRSHNFISGW